MGEKKKEKENENGGVTVVLKADFHCDGCASKVIKCIRSFDGVDSVTIDGQKITVVGNVDPAKLREKTEQKTHKKVELISPQPKKDGGEKVNAKDSGGDGKKEKKKDNKDGGDGKKSDHKSDVKEPPVTTAVLKLNLHCDGCIHKIYKTITKTKGFKDMKIDTQKDLVTVTGSMDMKALADVLQKQLKRDVTVVPPKKEGDNKEKGGGDGKGKSGDENVQGNKMQAPPLVYPYPFTSGPGQAFGDQFNYNPYGPQFHAPQIFSDENPNACSVM
ncbi:heavy metal-associated isoprenylated plant protein 3-like [Salvia splendens]|uniref:heavy metal-associated isoprenylated plant protein 3-like n=1 Tax=Salvia splendens TaxID=180675 RepID=UPI001C26F6D2|nr:heavy metal-associated isoprenylated plant protein 3-like [Salvia splendens]